MPLTLTVSTFSFRTPTFTQDCCSSQVISMMNVDDKLHLHAPGIWPLLRAVRRHVLQGICCASIRPETYPLNGN